MAPVAQAIAANAEPKQVTLGGEHPAPRVIARRARRGLSEARANQLTFYCFVKTCRSPLPGMSIVSVAPAPEPLIV